MVTDDNFHRFQNDIDVGKIIFGNTAAALQAIGCLNEACRKLTLRLWLSNRVHDGARWVMTKELYNWSLLPESSAKPQPDCIPEVLRVDYFEACRVRDLSPKASATLARRCLQGMIRDFCGIAKETLDAEIKALKKLIDDDKAPRGVTPESVDAIDHVRKIGNIGAHMEKDINLIIDIDPDEAQILIELIETLFEEWYVAREERQKRFANIGALRAAKDAAKKP